MTEKRAQPWTTIAVALAAILFWAVTSILLAAPEPWDSPHYATAFLLALSLVAIAGFLFPHRALRWGPVVIAAQAPVMAVRSGTGPLLVVGLAYLLIQCVPATGVALFAAWLRGRAA